MVDGLEAILGLIKGNPIFRVMNVLVLIITAFWFGKQALKGYRRKKNFLINVFGTGIIGIFCIFFGLVLSKTVFKIDLVGDFIGQLFVAFVFYIFLRSTFPPEKLEKKFMLRQEFLKMKEKVEKLSLQVERIVKTLRGKGLAPKPLSQRKAEEHLKEILGEKEIFDYKVIEATQKDDIWFFSVDAKGKNWEITMDAYLGKLKKMSRFGMKIFEKIMAHLALVRKNKSAIAGAIVMVLFFLFTLPKMTPSVKQEVFGQLGIPTGPSCPSPLELDRMYAEGAAELYVGNITDFDYFSEYFEGYDYTYDVLTVDDTVFAIGYFSETDEICSINADTKRLCSCEEFETI